MMNVLYIVWKTHDELGIGIIDEQHHAIVATINSLYYFIQEGWGLSALAPTLNIIKSYSNFHFKTEEGILSKAGYEELHKHIVAQKQFTKDVDAAAQEAIAYKDPFILLKFLKDWWVFHLKTEHLEYALSLDKLKEKHDD
ncbi:MAG: hemerythrin family protein [Methylotenera sp.]|uniref:bacteriohemerythrin n=1 Tax=Methylotenera sp. TaxID=2051956 RepID=UPI0024879C97|nr:hemerythrin family protein [Methylotenera sp.]MDI1308413.1 hemerythrin family protein [Methylotenera sp.]